MLHLFLQWLTSLLFSSSLPFLRPDLCNSYLEYRVDGIFQRCGGWEGRKITTKCSCSDRIFKLQNLYSENYNVLLKEIKALNKWKAFHGDRFEDLMWLRLAMLPDWSTDSTQSLLKSQLPLCRNWHVDLTMLILKKKTSTRTCMTWYQDLFLRCRNQESVVIGEMIYRLMEQNRAQR